MVILLAVLGSLPQPSILQEHCHVVLETSAKDRSSSCCGVNFLSLLARIFLKMLNLRAHGLTLLIYPIDKNALRERKWPQDPLERKFPPCPGGMHGKYTTPRVENTVLVLETFLMVSFANWANHTKKWGRSSWLDATNIIWNHRASSNRSPISGVCCCLLPQLIHLFKSS